MVVRLAGDTAGVDGALGAIAGGVATGSFHSSTLLRKVNAGDFAGAPL